MKKSFISILFSVLVYSNSIFSMDIDSDFFEEDNSSAEKPKETSKEKQFFSYICELSLPGNDKKIFAFNKEMADKIENFLNSDVDINYKEGSMTALVAACQWGRSVELVEFLISKGADVNLEHPIFSAIFGGSLEIIKTLHKNGAKLNIRSHQKDYFVPFGRSPFASAVSHNQPEIIQYFLDNKVNEVNGINHVGIRNFIWAISWDNDLSYSQIYEEIKLQIIKLLLGAGADLHSKFSLKQTKFMGSEKFIDLCGKTPIEIAFKKFQEEKDDKRRVYRLKVVKLIEDSILEKNSKDF